MCCICCAVVLDLVSFTLNRWSLTLRCIICTVGASVGLDIVLRPLYFALTQGGLWQIEVVEVVPYMMNQMKILLVCDLQGGLMDSKTRYSVQYAINLLVSPYVSFLLLLCCLFIP